MKRSAAFETSLSVSLHPIRREEHPRRAADHFRDALDGGRAKAVVMGFGDAFFMLAVFYFGLIILLVFLKKTAGPDQNRR